MPFVYLITTIGIYLIGLQTGTISYWVRKTDVIWEIAITGSPSQLRRHFTSGNGYLLSEK